jgi:hypothetical protein
VAGTLEQVCGKPRRLVWKRLIDICVLVNIFFNSNIHRIFWSHLILLFQFNWICESQNTMSPLLLESVLLESDQFLVTYTFSTFQQQSQPQRR